MRIVKEAASGMLKKSKSTGREQFLPFSRPSINSEDITAVTEVLKSGWITTGPKNTEFEKNMCDYTGSPYSVALSSATAGMHLLLKAFGIGEGDEVITPSMTWVSTVNLITMAGAKPVFADVDKDTLMIDKKSVENLLSPRVKMIIPVHFAGACVDMDPLRQIAKAHNINIIEDAAHALGTMYKGRQTGAVGTSVFSFHPIKNITTGEGGMICSDDKELIQRIQRLKFHGLGMDSFDRNTQGRLPQAQVIEPGFKYNLPDMLAALGISQLKRVTAFNKKRESLARLYHQLLEDVDQIIPLALPPKTVTHSWHLFIVRLDIKKASMTRDEFMEDLKKHNIGTGLHFRAVHLQKYYRETLDIATGALANTEWNSERILSLPLFPDMTEKDVHRVVDTIKKVLKK
jgi:UDP-4-amino-4-deoxy-L-arabinose-oxoglutarate aminotransferase